MPFRKCLWMRETRKLWQLRSNLREDKMNRSSSPSNLHCFRAGERIYRMRIRRRHRLCLRNMATMFSSAIVCLSTESYQRHVNPSKVTILWRRFSLTLLRFLSLTHTIACLLLHSFFHAHNDYSAVNQKGIIMYRISNGKAMWLQFCMLLNFKIKT